MDAMNDDILEKYLQAGKIAFKAKMYGKELIKEGELTYNVAEKIEEFIMNNSGRIAFPVNLSINEEAAHYTPSYNDKRTFAKGDLVKLDLGVHIEGYIADTALTVEVGTNKCQSLINASKEALSNAIKLVNEGEIRLSAIGEKIENTIKKWGYKPISNLTGHGLDNYSLHANLSIWNIKTTTMEKLYYNHAYAIEPFATNGIGYVENGISGNIFQFNKKISNKSDAVVKELYEMYGKLPFAMRWIEKKYGNEAVKKIMPYIKPYPILIEKKGSTVAQTEETIVLYNNQLYVTSNGSNL